MKKRNPNTSAPLTALERIATALETHLKLLQGGPILYGEVETAAEQGAPDCEPPALEEIARLLNGGEHAEALKELRRMHGLVDRFVCTNCGDISSSTGPGFVCRECGGYLTTRVVAAKETGQ